MLIFVRLTAFMRHANLSVDFSEGLNVIRGKNEAGKSSLLTGIAYNWFGAAMLPKPINDIVHRGCKKSQLMTVTRFQKAGREYECRRGISGAELLDGSGDILVTGQKEVTQRIEELFGIPTSKATDIIFAVQGGIRGVLGMGPTAAIELIEKLGDFGQIDEIIKKFTTTEPTGPTKHLEAQLEDSNPVGEIIDITPLEETVRQAEELLGRVGSEHQQVKATLDKLEAQGQAAANALRSLQSSKAILERQRGELVARASELEGLISEEPALKRRYLEEMQVIADYSLWNTYRDVLELPSIDLEWDEGEESLLAETAQISARVNNIFGRISGIERDIKAAEVGAAEGKLICDECGRPYDNAEEVRKAQARAEALADTLRKELDSAKVELSKTQDELADLTLIRETHDETKEFIEALKEFEECKVTTAAIPWSAEWVGKTPKEISHESAERAAPLLVKQKIEAIPALRAELKEVGRKTPAAEEIAGIEEQIKAVSPADPIELSDMRMRGDAAARANQTAQAELSDALANLNTAKTQVAVAEVQRKEYKAARERIKKQISVTTENNSILKALREARGKVSELLWNNVLTATSVYFSQFRGQPAEVKRAAKGFVINEETFPLSGSTLDVLGLALRISIAKVFADCPVLILDEPSAGCDEARTAVMTSRLKSVGFDQVILVTHKQVDEFVADNLIELS